MKTQRQLPDVVELTQSLVRLETTEKTRNERLILKKLAELYESFGLVCRFSQYDPDDSSKVSLVALSAPDSVKPALCFAGHIDTVPFGNAPWKVPPLSGEIRGCRLYGRGTADMKGGVAACTCAVLSMLPKLNGANIIMHVYGGEELGLLGSMHLAKHEPEIMGNIGAVVIAEPTSNRPQAGHKGVTWIRFETSGITAHAAMPDKGVNALKNLLPTASRVKDYKPSQTHRYLGPSTAVLATLHSGLNTNSVPDAAVMTLDVRTVAGQTTEDVMRDAKALADPDVTVSCAADIGSLWTDPEDPWYRRVRSIAASVTGVPSGVATALFATDGAALRHALPDTPMAILGPGRGEMAHQTDEFVEIQNLRDAQTIYEKLIADWYGIQT